MASVVVAGTSLCFIWARLINLYKINSPNNRHFFSICARFTLNVVMERVKSSINDIRPSLQQNAKCQKPPDSPDICVFINSFHWGNAENKEGYKRDSRICHSEKWYRR